MIAEADIKYAEERWPGAEMGSVRYGYLEGVRMEREACAKIADAQSDPLGSRDARDQIAARTAAQIAGDIRARST